MTAKLTNGNLVIEIPVNKPPRPSKTGKTMLVAATRGAEATSVQIDGQLLLVNLQAYFYPKK